MTNIQAGNPIVTQITVIEAEPEKQNEALSLMTERARLMASQPGFVSISLHRSLDGRRIINYIQWQNRELLQSAHQSPDFRKEWVTIKSIHTSMKWSKFWTSTKFSHSSEPLAGVIYCYSTRADHQG
jgi:quinol monooxygenase YgiN